jgi:SAM-dependent methyltransferase
MEVLLERTFEAEQRHFWFRGFKRFVAPLIEEATAGRSTASTARRGLRHRLQTFPFLQQYGVAFGLDYFWRGLEFGRARDFPRLLQGSVTHLPFADASIDVVLSFDVLYCLQADAERAAIDEMFRALRPGGSAVINVAALDILKGDHSTLSGEVRRYSRRQLHEKLTRAGFQVRRLTYTNASLFPITLTIRALQRMRGPERRAREQGGFLRAARARQRTPVRHARAGIEAGRRRREHACRQLPAVPRQEAGIVGFV